ncbi:dTDP-4-dehydrorhamnose 3,5-epimerase family protein [Roseicella aerolata]|uniref:dTDP-4-dehydrorhamnose 3,5-epimerase n=1 Tax=Roseicella aerolata TaxID=2883479 RepID=A0A9X1IEW0_9PROT|nr:dTDP-4-dehydrorhamnose 3,5-epimerase family protein [Roseicella aerolata]MCB4822839.1 dTDP-4-dehydrorhamnose 3,5-epimerase family protein [Roseicella aerolata]
MILRPTGIAGVAEVLGEPVTDTRGRFVRSWCAEEFGAAGLDFRPYQISISENRARHTLRGLHFQVAPAEERKLIRCLRGAVFDVAVDLRPDSPTYRRWVGVELTAERHNALFIPHGCAHGFLSLTGDAWLEYMIDAPYVPDAARGLRWNDPAFGITWPAAPAVISDRDRDWPDHG